jgi:hypothetical protein
MLNAVKHLAGGEQAAGFVVTPGQMLRLRY